MFELLKESYLKERQNKKQENKFFIEKGFMKTWNENEKENADCNNGLKRFLTDTRYAQFAAGTITREKAIEYATKRMNKAIDKEITEKIDRIDRIAAAPELSFIRINVIYKRSSVWGYCPSADVIIDTGETTGYASGYGYNKESSAVADAFNKSNAILKVLYTIKENGLKAGLSDASATSCTGVDNRNICGYGSGYSVLPHFEGGVGVDCFWEILKRAGYKTSCCYGKHENFYNVSKEVAQ